VGLKQFVLNIVFLMAFTPIASAATCPEAGYFETLIEPEKTEDGFIKITQYYFGSSEQIIHEAKYSIMTPEEYDALDKEIAYEAYYWEYPKISKRKIEPVTSIANYDLVRTIDGNSFYRPLEEQVNQKIIETHEIETPKRRKSVIKRLKRPEPTVLKDGRLKVMILPMYYERLANGVQKTEIWSQYIESRTPAVYQQVKCNEDK